MSISLSSHVLDTTLGKPAANMKLALTTLDGQVIVTQLIAMAVVINGKIIIFKPANIVYVFLPKTIY